MKQLLLLTLLLLLLPLGLTAQGRLTLDLSADATWNLSLDPRAEWKQETLYLPPVDVAALPVRPPTQGWDALFQHPDTAGIRVPATVEQYLWGRNGQTYGVAGNYVGVSWFATRVFIPREWEGRRMVMHVGSVRFRAEVFVNRQLIGYDLVNSTPFDIDLSDCLMTGAENEIAFRITDPNGNFNWKDSQVYTWGAYDVNPSHGFGGITGPVRLEATDHLFVSDLFIKNQPEANEIEVDITIANQSGQTATDQPLRLEIEDLRSGRIVSAEKSQLPPLPTGESTHTYRLRVADAQLWSVDDPHLYRLHVSAAGDRTSRRFGFRWFEARTVAGDRQLFLNNRRIVLRSAISWGYWPENGIFPTDALARRQVQVAKELGLNMLSFHRAIGQPNVLDAADELGLLLWEEPGGNQYAAGKMNNHSLQSDFYLDYRNQKLARMIRRDRSHPSLILYNLHNERGAPPQAADSAQMRMAHRLDPSRQILYNSSNGDNPEGLPSARFKLHLAPYDTTFYALGWYDRHHAGGPGVYHDALYRHPHDYLRYSANRPEIVYWGEEGAIGTPPRLALIHHDILTNKAFGGWEAADYLAWYAAYDRFLDEQGFRPSFPTVDALTLALGNVAYYYQGRMIENIRINNTVDGYAVNGWEAMKLENHSGIVDNYRNPKGDPDLIARYNRPTFLSVKTNRKVVTAGDSIIIDIFLVNENNISGKYPLKIMLVDEKGVTCEQTSEIVNIPSISEYGLTLTTGKQVPIGTAGSLYAIATLTMSHTVLEGEERIFSLPKIDRPLLPSRGLVADTTGLLQTYLRSQGAEIENYTTGTPQGNYLLVGAFEPQQWGSNQSDIVDWVQRGGALIIVDNPVRWAEYLADKEVLDYRGAKELGRSWYGGNFFNRPHPVFDDLPAGVAFNWEYQCFAAYNRRRIGLRLGSGHTLVGCVSDHRHEVYSALSDIPVGRGRILITTLDIPACLRSTVDIAPPSDADGIDEAQAHFDRSATRPADAVGRRLLLNMIRTAVDSN
jgi:hypothetical protein